jgi:hypothetical protein
MTDDLTKSLKRLISEEVEKQLVNRHIASKSWVCTSMIEWGESHLKSLQEELTPQTQRIETLERQVKKLFAMTRRIESNDVDNFCIDIMEYIQKKYKEMKND